MFSIELIPLDKGKRYILDQANVTIIGRTPNIGCLDKKISRNHAELYTKFDGTLWIKPIHHNPTFYRTKTSQFIALKKDEEFQLNDDDEIGLLPDEYYYRISLKSKDKQDEHTEMSAIPKSPIQENQPSPIQENQLSPIQENESSPIKEKRSSLIEDYDGENSSAKSSTLEPEGGVILHIARALPPWMTNSSVPESKATKGRRKGQATITPTKAKSSPSKYRTYIRRNIAEGVIYDDDEDSNEETATSTVGSTDQKVNGSTKRERCPYGKFCYRNNPIHRQEAIHPGDPDWNNKENDTDGKKPECPYGNECYRKNPNHFNEYSHDREQSVANKARQRTSKRKKSDDVDDDEDGLPNEYDYTDSFIDDEDLDGSTDIYRADSSQMNVYNEWKPRKKTGYSKNDDENYSTDDSEIDLLKKEAAEFIQDSSMNHQRSAKKKARVSMPDEDN